MSENAVWLCLPRYSRLIAPLRVSERLLLVELNRDSSRYRSWSRGWCKRALPGRLGPIEQFVLRQSCLGQTYSEMAEGSGYVSDYIREIGSQLWQDLSAALGQRVTKKNLHLVFNQPQQARSGQQRSQLQQELQPDLGAADDLAPAQETEIDFPGGPLPFGFPLYVERPPIEEITCAEISKPGCVIRVSLTSVVTPTA